TVNWNVGVASLVNGPGDTVIVIDGALLSTENARVAVPRLPASSVASTSNVCAPPPSVDVVKVPLHGTNEPASIRHCVDVAPPVTVNVKVGVVLNVVPLGPPVIVTTGATVSTVIDAVAVPWLPAASLASTANVCVPSVSGAETVNVPAHATA